MNLSALSGRDLRTSDSDCCMTLKVGRARGSGPQQDTIRLASCSAMSTGTGGRSCSSATRSNTSP
jgi:hypothetical protein